MARVRRPHLGSTERGVGREFGGLAKVLGSYGRRLGVTISIQREDAGQARVFPGRKAGDLVATIGRCGLRCPLELGAGRAGASGQAGERRESPGAAGVCTEDPGGGEPRGPEDRG